MSTTPLYSKIDPDTSRGLSANLWQHSLPQYITGNLAFGVQFKDDFILDRPVNSTTDSSQGGWYMAESGTTGSTTVTHNLTNPDGILDVLTTPSAVDSGVYLKAASVAGTGLTFTTPMHATLARGRLVWESRILSRTHGSVRPMFAGMVINTRTVNPLQGGSTMANIGHVGFYFDLLGDLYFTSKATNGGTAVLQVKILDHTDTQLSAPTTTPIKLGFAINDQPGGPSPPQVSFDIVVNEVWYRSVARQFASANAPTVALTPCYAIASGAASATAEGFSVDSVDVFEASIT